MFTQEMIDHYNWLHGEGVTLKMSVGHYFNSLDISNCSISQFLERLSLIQHEWNCAGGCSAIKATLSQRQHKDYCNFMRYFIKKLIEYKLFKKSTVWEQLIWVCTRLYLCAMMSLRAFAQNATAKMILELGVELQEINKCTHRKLEKEFL